MKKIISVIAVALIAMAPPTSATAELTDCVYSAKIGGKPATLTKSGDVYSYRWDDPSSDQDYIAESVTFDGQAFKIDKASLRIDKWLNSSSFQGRFKLGRFQERVVFTCG
ncbi:MAG: hypothetical protein AAGK23_00060 [Pseudomonadota bacterium]